jgi:hypothetical protein
MSPAGVAMFYGADDAATAIAEIGAHSSQRFAVLGEFETTRDLTVLDLTTLPRVPSLYTEAGRTAQRYDLIFLHNFAADLAKPIALDGREHIEYVHAGDHRVPTLCLHEQGRRHPLPQRPEQGHLLRAVLRHPQLPQPGPGARPVHALLAAAAP